MKSRRLLFIPIAFASACTFTPGDKGLDAAFHPLLSERHWHVEHAALPNGTRVCSLSSGYNGITVFLSDLRGQKDLAVKSNRFMQPGAILTVNAGGDSMQSYDTFFPRDAARRVVDDLSKGGTAYFEWSEFSGPAARERVNVQNVVPLEDFSGDLKECRDSLGQP